METIVMNNALKAVQSGLTQQDTAQKTQGIMLFGQDGTPNGKALLNTKAIVDVKSGRPLSEVLEYITPAPASDLFVDMGLPSGLLWARRNLDATQANGFAASEYQYECSFFSWGNIDPHNPTSNSSFAPYSFGSSNDEEPYVSSEGAKIEYPGVAGPSHDAARAIAGAPWHMPLTEDFAELFNSNYTKFIDADGEDIASDVTDKRITMNSIMGIRLKSKINGNILFRAQATAMARRGTIAARTATTGLARSTPPLSVGAWASTPMVSLRRATTVGSTGSRSGRSSNTSDREKPTHVITRGSAAPTRPQRVTAAPLRGMTPKKY